MSLFKYAADIIREAATSPLGLLALIILVVGVLAYRFFRNSGEPVRVGIFVLALAAACAFGAVVLSETQSQEIQKARLAASQSLALLQATQLRTSSPGEDWNNPKWERARVSIRSVFEDARAKRIYDDTRGMGVSKYASILAAQGDNHDAQLIVKDYGEDRTERYIRYDAASRLAKVVEILRANVDEMSRQSTNATMIKERPIVLAPAFTQVVDSLSQLR